ncbi:probable receptor-like protein kinase At1g80640 isoform X2 [Malania oleifera]|uniref:probable receptor-like protein kinase At1g80640 isoform X2 n=1 Tax=Malania oleifera TaxID=397392 RepID=UPI0025AE5CA1|nr:probable receptor-like protein kinase At1g80640 isoform X2 [Malania oleifera]
MNRLLSLPFWVFCSSFFRALTLIDTRPEPAISSKSGFLIPSAKEPISQFSAKMEAQSPEQHASVNKKILIALIVASTLLGVSLFLSCFWVCKKKKKSRNSNVKGQQNLDTTKGLSSVPDLSRFNSLKMVGKKGFVAVIEYDVLVAATYNFDNKNILCESRFGHLYKAHFSESLVGAVKRLDCGGQDAEKEFENEVDWLSKFQHQNIVSLLGYCLHGEARFLVYEMMQNGSLETQLHGPAQGLALSWHLRLKIAVDVARGLEFLHEHCNPPVIHRELNSSNILLDSKFSAKLSDFGLAISIRTQNKNNIKLSGALGYVAPEYLLDGKLTEKSDVYAFGVVLLELLLGRKPVEKTPPAQCQSIVTWAMPRLTDRSMLPSLVAPEIRNTMDLKHLYQVAAVAVLCVQPEPSYRPLITDVLHSLIPLVPVDLGGSLRVSEPAPPPV